MRVVRDTGFRISICARDDGGLEGAYIRCRPGKVASTREVVGRKLLADYDAQGQLLGIEVLAPMPMGRVVGLVKEQGRREALRRFVGAAMPERLRENETMRR
jgi:hypothetical protein